MAFVETQFPSNISRGASGGPSYRTDVVETNAGYEYRDAVWSIGRHRWDVAHAARTAANFATVLAFFHAMQGRAHGFRFKDWADYATTTSNGVLGTGVGTSTASYQLGKKYTAGSQSLTRTITKPVSVAVYRGGVLQTAGVSAGNYAVSTVTGLVTFVTDESRSITANTPGATTVITTTPTLALASAGKKVYLSGISGTLGTYLNGSAWTISSVAGSDITIAAATTGLTGSGGTASMFPQSSEALTWAGEFDVPARFNIDELSAEVLDGTPANRVLGIASIPIVEIRV